MADDFQQLAWELYMLDTCAQALALKDKLRLVDYALGLGVTPGAAASLAARRRAVAAELERLVAGFARRRELMLQAGAQQAGEIYAGLLRRHPRAAWVA